MTSQFQKQALLKAAKAVKQVFKPADKPVPGGPKPSNPFNPIESMVPYGA